MGLERFTEKSMSSPDSPKLSSALVCAAYHLCNEVRSLADMMGNDHKIRTMKVSADAR